MDYLGGMCGVKRIDRVRNDEARRRCGVSRSVITELDRAHATLVRPHREDARN